ncbi:MAG TPA: NrfD/PsrC family molybdoenzyme membrane anchor subunit [Roseiflexaceae bacterium]|nr:NrfD/PsrC family molybdoenzyme membrane anchor subunit [Roseiflexaceae bacterium]
MQSQRIKPTVVETTDAFLGPRQTYDSVTAQIGDIVLTPLRRTPWGWALGFVVAALGLLLYLFSLAVLFVVGVGIWGINIPVAWGFDIINFVWWIGIGHAGTLISAILLLFRQDWRTSINRAAEAMTIFAVACAGIYPLIHTGRPWLDYWLLPYPGTTGMWPQFRSPLEWDVFAVSTYATVSILFWFVGLIPDIAVLRDRARNIWVKRFYGILALGWRGAAKHWQRYEVASLILAGLSTPLVLSVHSIISFDFAVSQLPGWHVTVFPPYFVAGAVYCGFAMVICLLVPLRRWYGLHSLITMKHFDLMGKVMLASGLIVAYGYFCEIFYSWYSGNLFEYQLILTRMIGPYAWSYWALIILNVAIPQLLWFKPVRYNLALLFFISVCINIGMWFERWVIVVLSLHRDFFPSSWGFYTPTVWDWATYIGSFGLFFTLFFLFIRLLPMIAIFEVRDLVHKGEGQEVAGHGAAGRGELA